MRFSKTHHLPFPHLTIRSHSMKRYLISPHKKQYKAKILQTNGEEYFREVIFFSVGYDAIIGYANVVEITE